MKVKSKPLPPLRSLEEREREEEEEEDEMEMKELVANADEDKDDYYFEDPSNISKYAFMQLFKIYMLCISTMQYVLSSDSSS